MKNKQVLFFIMFNQSLTQHIPVLTILVLVTIAVLLPVSLAILATKIATQKVWFPPGIVTTLIVTSCICILFIVLFWKSTLSINHNQILVKAGLYKVLLEFTDISQINIERLEVSDLQRYKPLIRQNGVSLYQYHVGHFLSRNKEDVFLLIVGDYQYLYLIDVDGKYIVTNFDVYELMDYL